MEFCIAQPITDYDIQTGMGSFAGIYTTYFPTPDKFALILMCTVLPFAYEPTSKIPLDYVYKTLDHDLDSILDFELEFKNDTKMTVRKLLAGAESVNDAAAAVVSATNAEQNPIIKMLYKGSMKAFYQIVMARCFAHRRYQALLTRGAIESRHKNILAVNFQAKALTAEQEAFLTAAIHELNSFFNEQEEN